MEIELINTIPELDEEYRSVVLLATQKGLITIEEWNTKFKHYRDDCGYSFIHYLSTIMNNIENFITVTPIMLNNKKELEGRFNVKVLTPGELLKLDVGEQPCH